MFKVDINCDMGESFGLYQLGHDEEMMKYITSANIACGFHAGEPHKMRETVNLAKKYDVKIGAHPGFPDLMGFGRRRLNCSPLEIKDYITYQMGALREFVSLEGLKLQHCKPHGALYMAAMEDEKIARAFLEVISKMNQDIIVFALNNSAVMELGNKMGVRVAKEGYIDCEHTATGSIIPLRTSANLNVDAERIVKMVKEGKVITNTGEEADIEVQTLCIHGDTVGAIKIIEDVYKTFKEHKIEISPISSFI